MFKKILLYIQLTKPRLTMMAVLSGMVAFILAPKEIGEASSFLTFGSYLHIFICLYLFGAACNAMNQVIEYKLDKLMERTAKRPIPLGLITAKEGLIFSYILLLLASFYSLYFFSYELLFWGLLTFFMYIYVYTPLKTRSAFNTIVGAIPGALPIIIGWEAAGVSLNSPLVWILFFILYHIFIKMII